MKKVINVVFYKFYSGNEDVKEREQACLFYDDGTVENVSVERAVEETHKIAKEEKIKTKEELKEQFNKKRIYMMTGEELEKRFQEFVITPENVEEEKAPVYKYTAADYKMTQEAYDDYIAEGFIPGTEDFNSAVILDGTGVIPQEEKDVEPETTELSVPVVTPTSLVPVDNAKKTTPLVVPKPKETAVTPTTTPKTVTPAVASVVKSAATPTLTPVVIPKPSTAAVTPTTTQNTVTSAVTPVVKSAATPTLTPVVIPKPTNAAVTPVTTKTPAGTVTPVIIPVATPKTVTPTVTPKTVTPAPTTSTAAVVTPAVTPTVTPPKKKNIFQRVADKLKKNKLVRNIAIGLTALAIALFGYSCGARQSQEGQMLNKPAITSTMLDETGDEYLSLLAKTKNETQKEAMTHATFLMDNYNTTFAEAYIEEGKDVKAALTWDEMMALNLAYNDYTKEEIAAMFNGAEVDATEFSNAYKNGTLQLMGAYVIADSENPVNSYKFLRDEKQQEFVKKYEDMFYAIKNATTEEERIRLTNLFYAELYKDYPISDEVREVGISHAEGRNQLEPYKLAVTPIVAATEMMFQNLDIDHTLSDKAIAYFNDLGLCNLADEEFEKAMYITLSAETDKKNPTYYEFKTAKITELAMEDSYNITDAQRDLSQLDAFKYWVNGEYLNKKPASTGKPTTTTNTWTETTTDTWTETTTEKTDDRDEAVEKAGEEEVKKAEEEVDKEIEKENEEEKKKAEEEADKKQDELQEEADKEKEELEEQVKKDDEDLQEKIDDANKDINDGGTVNEDDFGDHDVDFDDEHSNEDGDLDDSVKDITTDGEGAVDENDPLPDPNADEEDYSYQETTTSSTNNGNNNTQTDDQTTQDQTTTTEGTSTNAGGQEIYEYEEEVLSNEELVDLYIQSLSNQSQTEESSKTYSL